MRVELEAVHKRYGKLEALAGVDLDLRSGARVALIGPNGSGKSTLTRVVMGLIAHTGAVRLDGRDAWRERAELARRLAYVPQTAPQMAASVGEITRAITDLRGLAPERVTELAARLDLDVDALRRRAFRGLSGGMKQKLLIALALAAEPSLLILDEPTASLDAAARARFFELMQELAPAATVILCSHRLEELRSMVDHVVALTDGRVVYDGPAAEYLGARVGTVLELRVEGEPAWLAGQGFAQGAGGWWRRAANRAEKLVLVPAAVAALGPSLLDLAVRDVDLLELEKQPEVRHAS